MSVYRAHLLLGVLLPVFACEGDLPLDAWQGEYVLYENSPSLQVCQGTYPWVDNFVPFVASELGLDEPSIQNYRWLEEDELKCRMEALGCAKGSEALSGKPFLLHELVHTTLTSFGYRYQPFFSEGLAFAFDPWYGDMLSHRYLAQFQDTDRLLDPRPWMVMPTEELHYPTAGSFVLFLLARHGSSKFLDFSRELGSSRNMDVIKGAFRTAYSLELDDEADFFMNGIPCEEQYLGPGLYDCTAPEVPWDGENWSLRGTLDCDSDAVAGGVSPDQTWASVRSVTLEVPMEGRYQIQVASEGLSGVQIGPCSSCPWERRDRILDSPDVQVLDLEPGTHFMRVVADSGEAPTFEVLLIPIPAMDSSP